MFSTEAALRQIGAYEPPPEYASEPQRYITAPVVSAIESFPFDRPGFIEESTTAAIKSFQGENGLTIDGWLPRGGETEKALSSATNRLARANRTRWSEYFRRASEAFGSAKGGEVTADLAGWREPLTNGRRGADAGTRPAPSKELPINHLPEQSQAAIGDVLSDPDL